MSLTTIISDNPNLKAYMKSVTPTKSMILTFSGKPAFSKEYELKVSYDLDSVADSALLGYAFDYMARWMIACHINHNKEFSFQDLIAEEGVRKYELFAHGENKRSFQQLYNQHIEVVKRYVYQSDRTTYFEVTKTAIVFSKLERIVRSNRIPFDITISKLIREEPAIEKELNDLCTVFDECFIKSNIIKENSLVVFNPRFGIASYLVDGADADMFIDGTLYDFKTTIKNGYAWTEFAQVLGYSILSNLAKNHNDNDNKLNDYEIKKIALYKARYGEVEYVDISNWDLDEMSITLESCIARDYDSVIKEIEEQEEEERKRVAEKKKKYKEELEELSLRLDKMRMYCNCHHIPYTSYYEDDKEKDISIQLLNTRYEVSAMSSIKVPWHIDTNKLNEKIMSSGMSITDISKKIGVSIPSLKSWLNGKRNPRLYSFMKLLDFFGCDEEGLCVIPERKEKTTSTSKKISRKKKRKKHLRKEQNK